MDFKIPDDLYYTKTHEWIKIDKEIGKVGLTDFAQHQLGDIVFIDLPEVGHIFEYGSVAGEIESVKAVGEIIMPVSGEIIEVNTQISDEPGIVNKSPYDEGWVFKISMTHPTEVNDLMSAEAYLKLVEEENH